LPPLLCADLRRCSNPSDRRCNWRFLGIFASPQDAIDAYKADPHFLGNRFAGLASAVERKDLIRLCPRRWSASAIFPLALSFCDPLFLPFEHEPRIVSIIFPVGLAVSKFMFKMRSPTSLAFSVSMILTKSLTLRAKRSSLQTTSVSPSRQKSIAASSCARDATEEICSRKIFFAPIDCSSRT
jgi:hypothetical protein